MLVHPSNAASESARCTTEAQDADKHAHNLTNWQQEYDQISGGAFYGRLDELRLEDMQLFKEHTNQALRQQCKVWPDGLWLGIPAKDREGRINGQAVEHCNVLCRPGGCDFELITPERFDIFGIVINRNALLRTAQIQGVSLCEQTLLEHPRLCIPPETLAAIRYLMARLINPDAAPTLARLQRELVMMSLMELLQKEAPDRRISPSYSRRKTVVDKVKQYLAAHADTPLTMTGLCELTCVSRRTLQYSFESIMGISPLQFLRMARLNNVRRALSAADLHQPIADIAAYWGFWHGGQFAKDYRQLFGETPSETVQRHAQGMTCH